MRTIKRLEEKLFTHYTKDEFGNYSINVSVSDLDELFSSYDPSPLHQKDIAPDILKMIMSQLVVFPERANVELHLHLPKKFRKKNMDSIIEQAIRHHLEFELLDSQLHLERRMQKGFRTLSYAVIIFVTLFTAAYFLQETESVILHLLGEGFWVGSWVSLWHPIEMLLYDWLPLYEEKKKYSRLLDLKIKFKYV
jgi:hypothetical protein